MRGKNSEGMTKYNNWRVASGRIEVRILNKVFGISVCGLLFFSGAGLLHAEPGESHHHGHDQHSAAGLLLNDGKRWKTDAALRQGMQQIKVTTMAATNAFHNDTLTSADANKLSLKISEQVNYLIKNCKLEPDADATLHVLLGDFLSAAQIIKAEPLSSEGMPVMVKALIAYPRYFDHPDWGGVNGH